MIPKLGIYPPLRPVPKTYLHLKIDFTYVKSGSEFLCSVPKPVCLRVYELFCLAIMHMEYKHICFSMSLKRTQVLTKVETIKCQITICNVPLRLLKNHRKLQRYHDIFRPSMATLQIVAMQESSVLARCFSRYRNWRSYLRSRVQSPALTGWDRDYSDKLSFNLHMYTMACAPPQTNKQTDKPMQ